MVAWYSEVQSYQSKEDRIKAAIKHYKGKQKLNGESDYITLKKSINGVRKYFQRSPNTPISKERMRRVWRKYKKGTTFTEAVRSGIRRTKTEL